MGRFTMELLARSENNKERCSYYDVSEDGDRRGLIARPAAIEKVTEVHDWCCRFIGSHKPPLETLNMRPTLEKLEEDWRTIQEVHGSCAR